MEITTQKVLSLTLQAFPATTKQDTLMQSTGHWAARNRNVRCFAVCAVVDSLQPEGQEVAPTGSCDANVRLGVVPGLPSQLTVESKTLELPLHAHLRRGLHTYQPSQLACSSPAPCGCRTTTGLWTQSGHPNGQLQQHKPEVFTFSLGELQCQRY
jgi:hypothetical protein